MNAFWQFLIGFPIFLGAAALCWRWVESAIDNHRRIKERRQQDAWAADARTILAGDRLPTSREAAEFLVKLQESQDLMKRVLRAANDPIIDVTLGDLKSALEDHTKRLEQRGIR